MQYCAVLQKKNSCLYDSEQIFKPILCKSQTKILSFSSVKKKKKKMPTDRLIPKTMVWVTANKIFFKDGLILHMAEFIFYRFDFKVDLN